MRVFPRLAFLMMSLIPGAAVITAASADDEFRYDHENVLGTSLELRVRADSEQAARWAETAVLLEIDRLATIFSGYDRGSEFSRWLRSSGVDVTISPELLEVLRAADHWRDASGGAFDPRVEVLSALWARSAARQSTPSREELAAALAEMGPPAWSLDPERTTARRLSRCTVSLNGIAKGFIVERACERALDPGRGVRGVLLNVGGDLRVRGAIDAAIGIADPQADSESTPPLVTITVSNRSVATSGMSQRGFQIKDRWYSHVINPKTGMPVDGVMSATVIASRSTDADALAKVFSVLDPCESLRLARSLAGVECLVVASDGRLWPSDGWHKYEAQGTPPARTQLTQATPTASTKEDTVTRAVVSPVDTPAPWHKDHELVVDFEINRPEGTTGRYRRPYVAVWIEDKEGHPVRTLALWVSMGGAGPFQWLPDLKRWFKADQDRKQVDKKDIFFTVSRPTRPPGKYKVIWDGKDEHGKERGAGEYVITIEAAREHGTYQSIRRDFTIADKPFSEDLKGNVEIKSARIEYRKKLAPK